MHIQSDRAFVPAGTPATRYLAVTISAPPAPASDGDSSAQPRAGVDVAFVLDRSGSMAGRKIDLARRAVAHAIRLLTPADRFALVVYDDEVNVLVEMTAATPQARAQALAALATVDARGATDLCEGWFAGARGLGASLADGGPAFPVASTSDGDPGLKALASGSASGHAVERVRRVLLLTDGLANRGVTDAAMLTEAARVLRAQGIGTSTFGLGADFDETLLTALAAEGGGHFYFLEHPQQIPDAFASELGEVLDVVARDAVFEAVAGPGTEVSLLNSLPVEQQGDVLRVRLGDLVADQERSLVVAIRVGPRAEGEGAFVACRVHDRDGVVPCMPMQVDWTAVSAEDDHEQPVNRAVVRQAARMLAEAARLQALDANRRGHFTQAREAIHAAVERIERLDPDDAAVQRVAAELRMEEDAFVQRMAPLEAKARHYVLYQMAHSRPGRPRAAAPKLRVRVHARQSGAGSSPGAVARFRIVYLWLPTPELALARVSERVRAGGHDVPAEAVRRRFGRGLHNFFAVYKRLAHGWRFYDASAVHGPRLVARGGLQRATTIHDARVWRAVTREHADE